VIELYIFMTAYCYSIKLTHFVALSPTPLPQSVGLPDSRAAAPPSPYGLGRLSGRGKTIALRARLFTDFSQTPNIPKALYLVVTTLYSRSAITGLTQRLYL